MGLLVFWDRSRGRLNNGGDAVLLLNEAGAVRLEVEYDSNPPWPVLPDGSGHSLILAKPSYGEDDHRAWSASEMIGGSPGQVDAIRPTAAKAVVINEFLAHTDDPVEDFIELYNASNGNVDISKSRIASATRSLDRLNDPSKFPNVLFVFNCG